MSQNSPAQLAALHDPQRGRKAVLWVFVAVGLTAGTFVASWWTPAGSVHEAIEWVGLFLIAACIAGRTWCSFYIGGNKVNELITKGPYSVSRNPLYVFSVIGAGGVGAMFGSVVFALVSGLLVYAVFHAIIRREEKLLVAVHGDNFRNYCERVPRFFPHLALWEDADRLAIKTTAVYVTFFDSLFFLLAIPLAEGIEWLQQGGWLQAFAWVP